MSPYRLRRLDWIFSKSPIFFTTASTHERRSLLANPEIRSAFKEFSWNAEQRGVYVGRYVLMPDHLHLFVAFSLEGCPLQGWVRSLKNALSKVLRSHAVESPHWQKGFFDHVLRSQESYGQKWTYVQLNPVRAGLVARPEEWPYQGEIFPLEF